MVAQIHTLHAVPGICISDELHGDLFSRRACPVGVVF